MSLQRKVKQRKRRRVFHVRNRLRNNALHPRVSVFRSLMHIYAQLIDDVTGVTIVSSSSLVLKDSKGSKVDIARIVGKDIAQRALEKGVKKVCFDRGRYIYHGRVKALAEGVREGGLHV